MIEEELALKESEKQRIVQETSSLDADARDEAVASRL
jgi:hypothetical protein